MTNHDLICLDIGNEGINVSIAMSIKKNGINITESNDLGTHKEAGFKGCLYEAMLLKILDQGFQD